MAGGGPLDPRPIPKAQLVFVVLITLAAAFAVAACRGSAKGAPTTFVNTARQTGVAASATARVVALTPSPTPNHEGHRSSVQPHGVIVRSGFETLAVDPTSGNAEQLFRAPQTTAEYASSYTYVASPDGTHLAYACAADGSSGGQTTGTNLCVAEGGGAPPPVVASADLISPRAVGVDAWSPDGHKVAFTVQTELGPPEPHTETYIYDRTTRHTIRALNGARLRHLRWSPDSRVLAANGNVGYFLIDALTGVGADALSTLQLDPDAGVVDAAWSPDSASIAFTVGQNGHFISTLYVASSDAASVRRIGLGGTGIAWSPDGSSIARSVDAHAISGAVTGNCPSPCGRLYAIRTDGAEDRALAEGLDYSDAPAWAPDSRRVAFRAPIPDQSARALYVMSIDDPHPQLTSGDESVTSDSSITWSLDGQRLVYTAYPLEGLAFQCGQGGCNDGYLYTVDAAGQRASRQLHDERISAILSLQP